MIIKTKTYSVFLDNMNNCDAIWITGNESQMFCSAISTQRANVMYKEQNKTTNTELDIFLLLISLTINRLQWHLNIKIS